METWLLKNHRELLRVAPDAVLCVNEDGLIRWVNDQAALLFRYPNFDLVGQAIEVLVASGTRHEHVQLRARYLANPQPRSMGGHQMLYGVRSDGTTFPAEISLSTIDTDEGLVTIAAVRDASARIAAQAAMDVLHADLSEAKLETQNLQARRLEAIGQLAGGVAHDFNNLLTAVSGYTGMLSQELADLPTTEATRARMQRDVDQIQRAVDRGASLTRQLLTFSRQEIVHIEPVDLNKVVSDMDSLLRRTLGEGTSLVVKVTDSRTTIFADSGTIEQVVVNLAINARDAMHQRGVLLITTAAVDIDGPGMYAVGGAEVPPGQYVRLCVTDIGTGMSPELVERIFEPFFTTKPVGQGTGLGLATVYGIVTRAQGFVRIESKVGEGTTFTVLFPHRATEAAHTPIAVTSNTVTGTETVLIVEDEESIRDVAMRMLQRHGYHVLTAGTGLHALEIARRHAGTIDMLVTDMVMPVMNGLETAAAIRGVRPDIKVLFMSGYPGPILADRSTPNVEIDLIAKPFTEATLMSRMRAVLDASRPV